MMEHNSDGTTHQIVVGGDQLARWATGSLLGNIPSISTLKKLVLVFSETSLLWRQRHGGPDAWVIPEYTVKCLIDDVLWLVSKGVVVETETQTADEVRP